jgi:Cu/Ag efflux protein CusF
MKAISLFVLSASLMPAVAQCCTCGAGAESPPILALEGGTSVKASESNAPARHPLKGVVVEVMADRSALLVKHEEIPGVMKAMTMLLNVDDAALKSAKKGDAVTGMLVKKTDGWWLEDVARVTTAE